MKRRIRKVISLSVLIMLFVINSISVKAVEVDEGGGSSGSPTTIVDIPVQTTMGDNGNKLKISSLKFNTVKGYVHIEIVDMVSLASPDQTDYLDEQHYKRVEVMASELTEVETIVKKDKIIIEGKVTNNLPVINAYYINDLTSSSLTPSVINNQLPKSIIFNRKLIELRSSVSEYESASNNISTVDIAKMKELAGDNHFVYIPDYEPEYYYNTLFVFPEWFDPSKDALLGSEGKYIFDMPKSYNTEWSEYKIYTQTDEDNPWTYKYARNCWTYEIPLSQITVSSFDIMVDGSVFFNKNLPSTIDKTDFDLPDLLLSSTTATNNMVVGTFILDSRWTSNSPSVMVKGDNCEVSYRHYYTQEDGDHYLYYYEFNARLLDYGSQVITISLTYMGETFAEKTFTIDNPQQQLFDINTDEFVLSTYKNYIDFNLFSNNSDMADKVSKCSIVDLDGNVVFEYPEYYKRFIEELNGYTQDRYLYTYRFPKKSMSLSGYFKGKMLLTDGTEILTKNSMDSSYLIWGDSSTSYDVITGNDQVTNPPSTDSGSDNNNDNSSTDNTVNQGIDKVKDAVKKAQDSAEETSLGKAFKNFLGANWLFILIGAIVVYKLFF